MGLLRRPTNESAYPASRQQRHRPRPGVIAWPRLGWVPVEDCLSPIDAFVHRLEQLADDSPLATTATTAGDLELRIPKLRSGSFFPSLLERRRRID